MNEVYIVRQDVTEWIQKHLPDKDLISISDLIGVIEDLDDQIELLKDKIYDMESELDEYHKQDKMYM